MEACWILFFKVMSWYVARAGLILTVLLLLLSKCWDFQGAPPYLGSSLDAISPSQQEFQLFFSKCRVGGAAKEGEDLLKVHDVHVGRCPYETHAMYEETYQ